MTITKKTGETIEVKLYTENGYFRAPCQTCKGETDKDGTYARWGPQEYDFAGPDYVMCTGCLEAGADAIPGRLIDKAEALEAWAASLRELAKCEWDIPSIEEWRAAYDAAEARYGEEPSGPLFSRLVRPAPPSEEETA